ncbi:uncharacterized protein [Asterias amurensis]|uniref:uncharacterized protein isoform X2 n=1 Tax=Asterias amurensis TaxID=7602 RepID=UPI003AB8C170
MSSRNQKDKTKNIQDKYQSILSRLLREEDNKYCADCDAKGPRWASWNLAVFLCIRCAGIHRNLGVHVSRVKSVNLDSWTEEQIMSVENGGNTIGRKIYEKHLPQDFRRPQTDSSSLEHFIRAKYDQKKYMDKDFVRPAPKKISDRDLEPEKKERKSGGRSKQQTLVALAKSRENVPRPHAAGLQPSAATSLNAAHLYHSSPNLTTSTGQPPATVPATPVKTVSSANDLLGLCTPPASNVNDLLGLDTPTQPVTNNPVPASNGTSDGRIETSLFGEDAEVQSETGGKKTKESIMALFGSLSSSSAAAAAPAQTQQPAFNVPGGVYIPSQQQQQVANGYPANSTMPGYQAPQQQQPPQSNGMPGYGVVTNNQAMIGQQQGMVGHPQSMMVQQPGMAAMQQGMMGQQPGMAAQQPGMMGQQLGMMGQQPGMPTQQAAMMGQQPGMMGNQGMVGMYGAPAGQQQSAYLQQQPQQQQQLPQQVPQQVPQQQQQFQMMQQQMTQQIQQQMSSMRVGSNPPQGQMQQPGWQSSNSGIPQQQAVPNAVAGVGGWGGQMSSSGQTLSNQLWK